MLTRTIDGNASAPGRLRIGAWWVDAATNELGRGGETLRVEPKVMEVLTVLAARAGGIVSRDELLAAVWPGVVVGDEVLTQCIIKLRRALGDNPRSPSYIETISKRGYRLIAPIRQGDSAPRALEATTMPRSPPARGNGRVAIHRLVAGLALVLVVAAVYFLHSLPSRTPLADAGSAEPWDSRQAALPTVMVLPFESLGASREQDYLARGLGNDLTIDLARLSGLRLISAPGAAASGAASSNEASRRARYLVSGSVQRVADSLRVNVRLVDAKTKEQLWSERIERPYGDLFAIQDQIIRRLIELVPGKISDAERERLAKRYTPSLKAYDLFLRAQALALVRSSEQNEEARALYRKAIELDPKFARAYAGLAMSYAMEHRLTRSTGTSPALLRARELAETARLIDPNIPEVHWALGLVHTSSRRHEQAIRSLERAIELNRSYADAYALIGGIHTYLGQPAKSIELLRTAMRLNPDGGYLYYLILGRAYLFENDPEQAMINLREALARNPVDMEARVYLAAALVAKGDRSAAEWEAVEIRALEPEFSLRAWLESYPMTSVPHSDRLRELGATLGL